MISRFRIDTTDFKVSLDQRSNLCGLTIRSFPRNYSVAFYKQISDFYTPNFLAKRPIIIDSNVQAKFRRQLGETDSPVLEIEPIESGKTVEKALEIVEFLDTCGVNKGAGAVAVGGGLIQDLAGFACGLFKRGVPWCYIPTTLLGQADSCVGGKTGLNFNGKKNLICSFSAPASVVICHEFIPLLRQEDIRCGLGEMLRLSITGGYEAFERFEDFLYSGNPITINHIADSLVIKKAVVELDEYELNERRAMNLGHTIAHAIEAATRNRVPHGVAVAFGIGAEALMASDLLNLPQADIGRIIECVRRIISPGDLENIKAADPEFFFEALLTDKKMVGKSLNFALLQRIGDIQFFPIEINGQFENISKIVSDLVGELEG